MPCPLCYNVSGKQPVIFLGAGNSYAVTLLFYSANDQKITNLIFKSSPNNNRSYQATVLCVTVSQEYAQNSAITRYGSNTIWFGA